MTIVTTQQEIVNAARDRMPKGPVQTWIPPLTVSPNLPPAPPGWSWHLLRDIARLESGHTPSRYRPDWWGGDVPWLALPDIRQLDGQVVYETSEYTNEAGIANSSARILPAGTICLSRTASVGFVTKMGRPMATSQDFVNWVCGPDLDPDFLLHLLIAARDYIREQSSGAIHKTVYVPTVKEFRICCPPLAEQKRIAGILKEQLATVERARAAAQAQLEAAKALPAAYLRELLSSAAAAGWPIKRLGNLLAAIEAGKCVSCIERPASIEEWGVLKVSAVTWGSFRPEENKVLPAGFDVPTDREVRPGDFLMSRSNTTELVGAVVHVKHTRPHLMLSDKTLRLVPRKDEILPDFMELTLRSPQCRGFIEENATGASSSMKNITQDTIRDIPVPVPPIDDQRRIMAMATKQLRAGESIASTTTHQLAEIEQIPAALLRAAFQGKL